LVRESALSSKIPESLITRLHDIASLTFVDEVSFSSLIVRGWEQAASDALEDDLLTHEEEDNLVQFRDKFGLTQEQLDQEGTYSRIAKAGIIRDLLENKIPQRINVIGSLPFNLQKGESLVWLFQNVGYAELRTTYSGSYQGVSLKVAKGVYYRTGIFRGNPTPTAKMFKIDTGTLGMTNKNIYFSGSIKTFRIPYLKIVSFTPYSDGLGFQRDAQTAKPQVFITNDGWFTYNLAMNLSRIASA
jgi:hypothetical protein